MKRRERGRGRDKYKKAKSQRDRKRRKSLAKGTIDTKVSKKRDITNVKS